jgi:hypothetical protein
MFTRQTVVVLVLDVVTSLLVMASLVFSLASSSQVIATHKDLVVEQAAGTPTPSAERALEYTFRVDLDAIGPAGPGRDLTIMNCDLCHSWICAVRGQRTLNHWRSVAYNHKVTSRVLLPDDDWTTLFSYLEQTFDDRHPVPPLPPIYQDFGCSYAEGGM